VVRGSWFVVRMSALVADWRGINPRATYVFVIRDL